MRLMNFFKRAKRVHNEIDMLEYAKKNKVDPWELYECFYSQILNRPDPMKYCKKIGLGVKLSLKCDSIPDGNDKGYLLFKAGEKYVDKFLVWEEREF